jgi:hypothetical protein
MLARAPLTRTFDLMEAFALLAEFDIPVLPSAYVESAEKAALFAHRRPTTLRTVVPVDGHRPVPQPVEADLRGADAVKRGFAHLAAKLPRDGTGRILAQRALEPGSVFMIVGERDGSRRTIRLVSSEHMVERRCPLTQFEAESMIAELGSKHSFGSTRKAVKPLAQLLVKAAKMYEESPIETLVLAVRLHDNTYVVVDALLRGERPTGIARRLEPRAHDRNSNAPHLSGCQ